MTFDELAQHALSLLHSNAGEQCVACAEQAIAMEPHNGFIRIVLGVALKRIGRGLEALEQLELATVFAPDSAQAHYNFAVTLHEAGRDGNAMAEYRKCLECDPDYVDALWNYGELLRLNEHFEQALLSL